MAESTKIKILKLCQKFIYVFFLLMLILFMIAQTVQCFVKYFQGPTYISSEIVAQKEAGFPAMTVCPISNGYKEEVLQEHGIPTINRYNYKTDLNWTSNQTDVSESELFELATYRFDELLKRVYIRFFNADESGSTNTVLDLSSPENNSLVKEQRHRGFGRCYTIYPDENVLGLGVYYYKIYFHEDVKVYFHRDEQFLDLSGRMGYKIYKGDIMQSQVQWHDIRMMSKDTKEGEKTCIDANYDECMYGAMIKHMKTNTQSEGGCTVPWVMEGQVGSKKICKEPENVNRTFWEAWNRVTNQLKDCPIPCKSLLVSLGAKNFEKDDTKEYGTLYLYFAPRTMVSEELILYTPLSLFAEIGGYVGLLLGVSLWNFAAWISDLLEMKIKKLQRDDNKIGSAESRN